jgi:hypothetical protein
MTLCRPLTLESGENGRRTGITDSRSQLAQFLLVRSTDQARQKISSQNLFHCAGLDIPVALEKLLALESRIDPTGAASAQIATLRAVMTTQQPLTASTPTTPKNDSKENENSNVRDTTSF